MLAKPLMFLSSYTPLFGLLALRVDTAWIRNTALALAAAGILSVAVILMFDRASSKSETTVATVSNAGSEAASYLAGYLLPFLVVASPTTNDVIAYAGFLVVVGFVTVKTGVIQVNPLLFLIGYSVFKVTDTTGASFYLLSRKRILPRDDVIATGLGDDVRVHRPKKVSPPQ